jgi:hypothetical protein
MELLQGQSGNRNLNKEDKMKKKVRDAVRTILKIAAGVAVMAMIAILIVLIATIGAPETNSEGEPGWCEENHGEMVDEYIRLRDHGKTAEERAQGLAGLGYRADHGCND